MPHLFVHMTRTQYDLADFVMEELAEWIPAVPPAEAAVPVTGTFVEPSADDTDRSSEPEPSAPTLPAVVLPVPVIAPRGANASGRNRIHAEPRLNSSSVDGCCCSAGPLRKSYAHAMYLVAGVSDADIWLEEDPDLVSHVQPRRYALGLTDLEVRRMCFKRVVCSPGITDESSLLLMSFELSSSRGSASTRGPSSTTSPSTLVTPRCATSPKRRTRSPSSPRRQHRSCCPPGLSWWHVRVVPEQRPLTSSLPGH